MKRFNGTTGAFIDNFVSSGSGGLTGPDGLQFGPDSHLYVVDNTSNAVLRYDGATGAFMGNFVTPGSGGLNGGTALLFVPEPGSGALIMLGVAALVLRRRMPRRG